MLESTAIFFMSRPPTGPARSGRPDDKLLRASSKHQKRSIHPHHLRLLDRPLMRTMTLEMTEKTLNLRGLKCPLPALRTKKALGGMAAGDILVIELTDPLAGIDIPNLLNQTGDTLEATHKEKRLLTFRIRKR